MRTKGAPVPVAPDQVGSHDAHSAQLHKPGPHRDLKDRLSVQLTRGPSDPYGRTWTQAMMCTLVEAVQAMDRGITSEEDTGEVFKIFRIPGFSFESWLAEMIEEGVYLETALLQAA